VKKKNEMDVEVPWVGTSYAVLSELQGASRVVTVEACLKRSEFTDSAELAHRVAELKQVLEASLVAKARAGSISLQAQPYHVVLESPFSELFESVALNMRAGSSTGCTKLTGTPLPATLSRSGT
jgi:ABC-type uncharacterized transport system YnjBCD ATPase subunit